MHPTNSGSTASSSAFYSFIKIKVSKQSILWLVIFPPATATKSDPKNYI